MSIMPAPAPNPDREVRRWTLVRDDYLAGATAETVCRRYGVALSTFRRRAQQEGWRRADQPPPDLPPPPEPEAEPEPAPDLTAARMAAMAWRRVQEAVHAGRLIEARGWMRLYKDLNPYAEAEAFRARVAEQDRRDQERKQTAPEDASPAPAASPRPDRQAAPDLLTLTAELEALTRRTEQAVLEETARLLDMPDDPELTDALRTLQTELDRLAGAGPPRADETRETLLDRFSESHSPPPAHPSEGWGPDHRAQSLEGCPNPITPHLARHLDPGLRRDERSG